MTDFERWQQNRLDRWARMRLFFPLHQDDDPIRRRASGEMCCDLCGVQYTYYPYFDEQMFGDNGPVDHRLCDGDVVHL